MIPSVREIEEILFEWAPRSLAEEWDNVGLQCGNPDAPVKRIVICLDITPDSLSYALKTNSDLVISHHPLIFRPLNCLNLQDYTARLLAGFLRHDISVISMHTNLDSCTGGVNDKLCELLEIDCTSPLIPSPAMPDAGLGRVGRLKKTMSQQEFIEHISQGLGLDCIPFAGDSRKPISLVAVCSGSGSTLFDQALAAGAQAYVTAEIKHSVARKAEAEGILLVDAGHFHTEHPVVNSIFKFLTSTAETHSWDVSAEIFKDEKSPTHHWKKADEKQN